jgi:restriction endonuclease Mrr
MINKINIELNDTYHYPPELLELLTDTIPSLFRSKQAVIDFFKGAGTPSQFLTDWQSRLRLDKESVRKHELTRSVLRSLNEGGDSTLRPRREIIKRVSEFEDFTACWESDRLKAQALVGQVRHIVNVKDSFTRINIERERERSVRQRSQQEVTAKIQKQRDERLQIRSDLYALFAMTDPHKRGKALVGVLNRLFANFGMLVREAFTVQSDKGDGVIEQIDGAVEINGALYIVEMKWWDKPIGRQEMAPHLVSVFNRGGDVRGIFIAYSGFSAAAIADVKNALAHKIFVLTELEEIVKALDAEADIKELFVTKIQHSQTHKEPLYKRPVA